MDRQREEMREDGHIEMNVEADHLVLIREAPEPYTCATDPLTLEAIPDPPDYKHPPGFWDGVVLEERVIDVGNHRAAWWPHGPTVSHTHGQSLVWSHIL